MDENLLHCSYEAGVLENPAKSPPENMFHVCKNLDETKTSKDQLRISFAGGIPSKIESLTDGTVVEGALEMFKYLNKLGAEHGIGRIDMVENRFVGMKSRGCYETPGLTILRTAHIDLEGLTMDREVRRMKQQLSLQFADKVYNGFWFSPEMEFLINAISFSQKYVNGDVDVTLFKGNCRVNCRRSETSLYNEELASMDVEGSQYDAADADGFIKINAVRLRAYADLQRRIKIRDEKRAASKQ